MATPVASGAVALLLQQTPGITPDQVKARLMKTADKMGFPLYDSMLDSTSGITYNHLGQLGDLGQQREQHSVLRRRKRSGLIGDGQ